MRTLNRNKRSVWFSLYLGVQELQDEEGNFTGEYAAEYEAPQKVMANVSPASGKDAIAIFGTDEQYDKVIVADWKADVTLGVGQIDENTVWFIDTPPSADKPDGYDYIVKRIARSLNSVTIALQKINNAQ